LATKDQLEKDSINEKFSDKGSRCILVKFDVSIKNDVLGLKEKTLDIFSSIDILINNAGAQSPFPFEELSEEAWDRIMDVDLKLKGTFYCSQILGRQMIKQKSGVIVKGDGLR